MMLFKDQQMENLLCKRMINMPTITCSSGNRITRFCSGSRLYHEVCKNDALCCNEESCTSCNELHENCYFSNFSQLTRKLQNKIYSQNSIIRNIIEIEDELMKKLFASRNEMMENKLLWSLEGTITDIARQIYINGNGKGIKFQQINALFEQVSAQSPDLIKQLKKYKQEGNVISKKMIQTKAKLIQTIMKSSKQAFKSNILRQDRRGKDQANYLFKQLGNPAQLKLLFRASQHDFSAKEFHKICNNIPNNVTIVRTEFDKTIAAFTPLEWKSRGQQVKDPSCTSFLLQLELKQRMSLIKGKQSWAIFDSENYGPTFGGGYDLNICDRCNVYSESQTYFPTSYNNGHRYQQSQQTYTAFNGQPKGKKFKVIQYEVFQVIK